MLIRLPAGKPIELEPAPTQAPIAVHVTGAVPRPGLYKLPEGSRVQDAIDAAGGLLSSADADSMNLAALLEDGQKLDVPYAGGVPPDNGSTSQLPNADPTATAESAANVELVNINTASLEELNALPGIGPTTAQNIIDYRDENGPFQSIEDLMNVPGMGPTTYEGIQDLITV